MKNCYFFLIFVFFSFLFFGLILAQELPRVSFPVAELGNCGSRAECAAYCDDIAHIEECLTFAERYGLIPPDELEEGKKVATAIKQGITPPNCRNKTECDVYCMVPENMEECLTFAEAAGLIPPEELENAKMALEAIKKGVKPPPCRGKAECGIYCQAPEHLEDCITFAEAAGFISPEEAAMVRKTGGKGPGNCRGEEACAAYCEDPANMEECLNFAVQIGEVSPEQVEQARRSMEMMQRGGPGGCKSEEECKIYCQDPAHAQECITFSIQQGFISPEEGQRMLEMLRMPSPGMPPEEMMPEGIPPEYMLPEGMIQPPSPEEIERMKQEAMEEAMRKAREMMPSEIPPQTP